MQDLTVTLVQAEMHWQNPPANRGLYEQLLADSPDTDLVMLPEMFTTGFTMDAAEHAEPADGESTRWLKQIAGQMDAHICGSLIIHDAGHFYNRMIWATPAGEIFTYDKRHLFRMANEQEHYSAGHERLIVTIGEWRICPLICYDLRFPVWSRSRNDYDLLIYVANWPAARQSAWTTLIPARAVENLCYTAAVNRVGIDGNNVDYQGGSMIADYLGNRVIDAGNEPGVFAATLSLAQLNRYRDKFPAWKDADAFQLTDPTG